MDENLDAMMTTRMRLTRKCETTNTQDVTSAETDGKVVSKYDPPIR